RRHVTPPSRRCSLAPQYLEDGDAAMARVPVQNGIFSWPSDEPKLLGGGCKDCSTYNFPFQTGRPSSGGTTIENVELASRGTLWTWTTQNYPPPVPPFIGAVGTDFEPYAAGYVELPGQIRG